MPRSSVMDLCRPKWKSLPQQSEAGTKSWQRRSLMPFAKNEKLLCEVDFRSESLQAQHLTVMVVSIVATGKIGVTMVG